MPLAFDVGEAAGRNHVIRVSQNLAIFLLASRTSRIVRPRLSRNWSILRPACLFDVAIVEQHYTGSEMASAFQPLPLVKRPKPFSHRDWAYEVKYDGFRALAQIENGSVRLVSRNGNTFATFKGLTDGIGES